MGGHFAIGTSLDISLAGMSFETTLDLAVGSQVFVTLVLEQNRPLHAQAQVIKLNDCPPESSAPGSGRYAAPQRVGRPVRAAARWDAMCPADRQRLEDFLVQADRPAYG
jgi:hypothetical protein